MSRVEKRLKIDFKELVIHPLYEEIAPEIFMISEQNIKQFGDLAESMQEYLAIKPIKVIERDGEYNVISGISQYLKLAGNTKKLNVAQVLKQKHSNEAFVASDILTSDLFLWHPHAEKIYAFVIGYLQEASTISKEVEKLTYLNLSQFNHFINGVSLFCRAKYYKLKKQEENDPVELIEIAFSGTLPLKFLTGEKTNNVLELNFDDERQFVSAKIKNENTDTDITSKVSFEMQNKSGYNALITLDRRYRIDIQFTSHLDFNENDKRFVFFFNFNKLSSGKLFTTTGTKIAPITYENEVFVEKQKIGQIVQNGETYTFHSLNNSDLKSDIKHVLLNPSREVQP